MADIPHPEQISNQVWIVPCKISSNKDFYIPIVHPKNFFGNEALGKIKWTKAEEDFLKSLTHKTKRWSAIAKEININFHGATKVRDGKQCRERWNNHLNPLINKEKWTEYEDSVILDTWNKIGPKWAQIAKMLQNRTENQVKNRMKSLKLKPDSFLQTSSNLSNNLSKLESIEPMIHSDLDSLTPLTSIKFEDVKSSLGSISSIIDGYLSPVQSEQYFSAQRFLDNLLSNP